MKHSLVSIDNLNAFIESAPSYDKLVNLNNQLATIEKSSGVAIAKILICAKHLYNDKFADFYKANGYEKTYVSKIIKTETVIRMIELWNELNIYDFSINQLIELARIEENKFAELLTNGKIKPNLTIKQIRSLVNEISEIEATDSEGEEISETAENKPEKDIITIERTYVYAMLECCKMDELKNMIGALLH